MHQEEHELETAPSLVSSEVLDGLEAVRQSGHTNMLDDGLCRGCRMGTYQQACLLPKRVS